MGKKRFIHELPECGILIEQVAQTRRLRPQMVEKDYWLMHSLWGLQHQKFSFELKGGTSLSKGFGIIDRFSEDIDIKIEPPAAFKVKVGKNQDSPSHIAGRVAFYDWLSKEITMPGISTERDREFDDKKGRNGGIRLNYESRYPMLEGLKTFVLLEAGFAVTTPNEKRTISSWLYDAAIAVGLEVQDNRAVAVPCYLPGFTLIEKLAAISGKFQQEQEGKLMPVNFIRHYYDVYQLLGQKNVQEFIGTSAYREHKSSRFRKADQQNLSRNEAFVLEDAKTREGYSREYERMRVLCYGIFPSFDSIVERIHEHLTEL